MQPSPRSTRSLLKTLPGACRSPSDDLGVCASGGWLGPSLTYLLQVPYGTAAARAKVYRASSPIPLSVTYAGEAQTQAVRNSCSQYLVTLASRILSRPYLLAVDQPHPRAAGEIKTGVCLRRAWVVTWPCLHEDDLSAGCRGRRNLCGVRLERAFRGRQPAWRVSRRPLAQCAGVTANALEARCLRCRSLWRRRCLRYR